MKTLGLLGGMTWHSTAVYYDQLNRRVAARLGPYRSASLVLHSVDYGIVREARRTGDWRRLGVQLVDACRGLKRAGADRLVICSNTIHHLAPRIEDRTGLEVLHVTDAVLAEAATRGVDRVGLLGTAFTTLQPFYRSRLEAGGLEVVVPDAETVAALDRILLDEVARGELRPSARATFVEAMERLADRGARAMVLACTEIGLLVGPDDLDLPVLDTVAVHTAYAVDKALADGDEARSIVPLC